MLFSPGCALRLGGERPRKPPVDEDGTGQTGGANMTAGSRDPFTEQTSLATGEGSKPCYPPETNKNIL